MKRLIVKGVTIAVMAAALALPLASPAFADQSPVSPTTGQPGTSAGVNCNSPTNPTGLMEPGQSSGSLGAPFNETMPGQADNVYAGNPGTASLANSNSTAAVSQYDVACLMVTSNTQP